MEGDISLKKLNYLMIFSILILLVGCNKHMEIQWFNTMEKAIKYGLEQEGTDETAVLSIEDYQGETIVFYEHHDALGVASITESEKGFSWYRGIVYHGLEGDSPYLTIGFDYKTQAGLDFSVLAGKASDPSIQKMKLIGDGPEKELTIFNQSRLFYAVHEATFNSLEVFPIKAND